MKYLSTFRAMVLFAVLALVIVACVPIQAPTPTAVSGNTIEATFVCPDGTELDTVFDNDADTVTVVLPDGSVTLPRTISGSGARYSDDTTTFWNKGDEAMVEVNGETVYKDCVAE